MNEAHTPGPWRVVHAHRGFYDYFYVHTSDGEGNCRLASVFAKHPLTAPSLATATDLAFERLVSVGRFDDLEAEARAALEGDEDE